MMRIETGSTTQDEARVTALLANAAAVVEELTERCAAAEAGLEAAEQARLIAESKATAELENSRSRIMRLEALVTELRSALRIVAADLAEQSQANVILAERYTEQSPPEGQADEIDERLPSSVFAPPSVPVLRRVLDDASSAASETKARMMILHSRMSGCQSSLAERAVA